jgi:hypothetical protein
VPFRQWVDDPGGLHSWEEIQDELRSLAAAHPERSRLLPLGHSAEGRPLLGLRVAGDPDDLARPAIFLVAAHHANEAATPEHVMDAVRDLLSHGDREPYATWLDQMALVAVPMVNPDGSHAFWEIDRRLGRKNRRQVSASQVSLGVDLNRNYPFLWDAPARKTSADQDSRFYRGPAAASEPEVRAMINLARQSPPAGMVTYHSAAAALLVPYAITGAENPEPSTAWAVAREMVERLPHEFSSGRRIRAMGGLYPVSGVEKDWYHHEFGTLAYLLELPFRRPRGLLLQESVEHTRAAWQLLFERWLRGPALSVRTVDQSGTPVVASVQIDEIVTRAGEVWRTHAAHGWFHTYLPNEGSVTIRLGTEDVEIVREVKVEGWTRVEVVVEPPLLAQ